MATATASTNTSPDNQNTENKVSNTAVSLSERKATDFILSSDQLKKIYGGRAVVDGVSIRVGNGEIVGLLGPNGAGKTTTFYMIAGLVPPNAGSVHFFGDNITKVNSVFKTTYSLC